MNPVEFQWNDNDGKIIACEEKNKILNQNMLEIIEEMQNSYEDSTLMGVSIESFRQNIRVNFELFLKNLS